jgi:hypothetical protein
MRPSERSNGPNRANAREVDGVESRCRPAFDIRRMNLAARSQPVKGYVDT